MKKSDLIKAVSGYLAFSAIFLAFCAHLGWRGEWNWKFLFNHADAQSQGQGWAHGNAFKFLGPQSDPTVFNEQGAVILYENLDAGATIYNGATKQPHQLAMTEVRCGTLADAGGAGKSNAFVPLPFSTASTCQCNETSFAASGLASPLGAWTDGGQLLTVVGGSITTLDNFCCTCTGL